MKKVFITLAMAAAVVALPSCSGSKSAETAADSDSVAVETSTAVADQAADMSAKLQNCTNPDSIKIYSEEIQKYAEQLKAEGKDAEAAEYINAVLPAIQTKAPTLVEVLNGIKDKAVSDADAAKEALKDAAENTVESGKEAGKAAVDAAKDAGKAAVDGAKQKANDAVNDAKQKANDAAKKAADQAKNKYNEGAKKINDAIDKAKLPTNK